MSNTRRPTPSRPSGTPRPGTTRPGTRAAAANASSSRRLPVLIGIVLVLVLAAVIAVVATSGDDDSSASTDGGTTQERGNVQVAGAALPAATASGLIAPTVDPAVGVAAPLLTGVGFTGGAVSIPAVGKPTIVLFVAHWCPHCQAEVPLIQKWRDSGSLPSGVELLTVSTSVRSNQANYPPSKWLAKEKWTAPVMVDTPENFAAQAYGLQSFPYFVAVGVDGKVKMRATGELSLADVTTLMNAAKA